MRHLALIFVIALTVGLVNGQTGPKAKNAKPWNKSTNTTVIVASVNQEKVTGPKAKNTSSQERFQRLEKASINTASTQRVTGPKAKNAKPWRN